MTTSQLFIETQSKFQANAMQANAAKFKAFMKDHFEFYGVMAPKRKEIQKELKPMIKALDADQLWEYAQLLWSQPKRELHYVAIDMLQFRGKWWSMDHMPQIEELIITNSWWDSVDPLAANIAGQIIRRSPEEGLVWLERWIDHENMWLNRSAIIHQLRYKNEVDTDLLFALIDNSIGSKEFFINKACGWALRQASKFYPAEVKDYIESRPNLANLTIKEGSKYL